MLDWLHNQEFFGPRGEKISEFRLGRSAAAVSAEGGRLPRDLEAPRAEPPLFALPEAHGDLAPEDAGAAAAFATSPGALIARFSILSIMLTGVAVLSDHIAVTLTGTGLASYLGALILLGVGWNFLCVGATTLLTETCTSAERGRPRPANDLIIYAVGRLASLGVGAFLETLGLARGQAQRARRAGG
jgi:hypothetical protein